MYIIFLLLTFVENIRIVRKYAVILSLFLSFAYMAAAKNAEIPERSEAPTESIELWADTNRLYIRNGEPGSKIVIYSIVGTKVSELELKNANSEIFLQLPKGYYIVKIGDAARKIAIK